MTDMLDRLLMHNPQTYIVFGAIAVALIVSWAFYIWKLGGFVRYFGNPWPSLLIIAVGAVAGLAVYGVALKMQKYPTLKEIQDTPSWDETKKKYQSNEAPEDKRSYEESTFTIKDDDEIGKKDDSKTSRGYNPLTARRSGNREVIMDSSQIWRERLVSERDYAFQKAKNTGIASGLLVVVLGYLFAAVRLPMPLRREDYEMPPQEMAAPVAPIPVAAPAPETKAAAVPPPAATGGDDLVLPESGDSPVSIDELEKGYTDFQKRKEELR